MVMTQPEAHKSSLPAWLIFGGIVVAVFGGVIGGEIGPVIASAGLLLFLIGGLWAFTRAMQTREIRR